MKYTEGIAIRRLMRNGIAVRGHTIYGESAGLKLLGAIDFLVNHLEYIWIKEESPIKKFRSDDDS